MRHLLLTGAARAFVVLLLTWNAIATASGEQEPGADWTGRFAFTPPTASADGVCAPSGLPLPSFAVRPAAAGRQVIRASLPFPPGAFPAELSLAVLPHGGEAIVPDVRLLTLHPGRPRSVRRAIVTFPFTFADAAERRFSLALRPRPRPTTMPTTRPGRFAGSVGVLDIEVAEGSVAICRHGGATWRADLIAPTRRDSAPPTAEVIEWGEYYLWVRLIVPDPTWPRILEVRADALGSVGVRAHIQRLESGDGHAPDLGWRIRGPIAKAISIGSDERPLGSEPAEHRFRDGTAASIVTADGQLGFPDAHLLRRGVLRVVPAADECSITYLRCEAAERVPHQEAAWRQATFALMPAGASPLSALLEPAHTVQIPPACFIAAYGGGEPPDLAPWPELDAIRRYHRDAMVKSVLVGDDFGNITAFPAGTFGMNRLNHCPPIFEEYRRSGDARLREAALLWCGNFHDLSIWWGTERPGEFGGTRYNNISAQSSAHKDDRDFMWRSNTAVHFCTKGFDAFLTAYEETGDPRMATALRWQVAYAQHAVHADRGECRNIGIALDFVNLHRLTGHREHLDQALRLFRELRTRLSTGDLFSQNGQPILADPPFIDEDGRGLKNPFAKPYIIGYALAGLPDLARYAPEEPKLRDVIRAVADFLAGSQDPVGGWRYPHPRSSRVIVGQGIEHAAQLARAAEWLESRGEPIEALVDAIERTLQSRILVWRRTGQFFSGLSGWEAAAGVLKDGRTLYDLYQRPADRDPSRDYTEGPFDLGTAPPEGIVYFGELLRFYLARRPAERLDHAHPALQRVLDRMPARADSAASQPTAQYSRYGMADRLPTFAAAQVRRMTFPLAYEPSQHDDFGAWRAAARARLLECLGTPPPRAAFEPVVIAEEDRSGYTARKIVFNVSADCRIPAYVLIPKGHGPFPAVIALHDHGAHFSIGKEKVVRPFDERQAVLDDAAGWVARYYGDRYVGDELAARGYVVFAADALFWGDRGRREGVDYAAQQELAANLLQLGMTWAGVITWDDIRGAEFVASLPEVDPTRIGAVGLSMGCHRTWMLCAATDRVAAGVAVCWMGTTAALMAPGNNQTRGQSAFSMLVPFLRNDLDYADVAAIACPKPMLFFNGERDPLFPVAGVQDAYGRLRRVWEARGARGQLVTRLWPVEHVFDRAMQDEAFRWLDRQIGQAARPR